MRSTSYYTNLRFCTCHMFRLWLRLPRLFERISVQPCQTRTKITGVNTNKKFQTINSGVFVSWRNTSSLLECSHRMDHDKLFLCASAPRQQTAESCMLIIFYSLGYNYFARALPWNTTGMEFDNYPPNPAILGSAS